MDRRPGLIVAGAATLPLRKCVRGKHVDAGIEGDVIEQAAERVVAALDISDRVGGHGS